MKNFLLNRNFALIWCGQFISQIGDKFYGIALAWLILQQTGSPAAMGFYMLASALPGFLFGAWAGGCIDRWDRKRTLVIMDFARGAVVLSVALLSAAGVLRIWQVFVAGIFISLASAFFNPAAAALLPCIVARDELPRANSLNQLISGLTTILGPAAGAAVIALAGYAAVFLLNSVSFIISGFLVIFIRGIFPAVPARTASLTAGVKTGFRYIAGNKRVSIVLAFIGLAHLYVGSLSVSLPVLAGQLTGLGVRNLGFLEAAVGGGMFIGSLLLNLRNGKSLGGRWLFGAMKLLGAGLLSIGACRWLGLTVVTPYLVLTAVVGLAVAVASIFWTSYLQANVPNELAGRIFGIAGALGNTSLPVAYGLFGVLLEVFSVGSIAVVCGACLIAVSLVLGGIFRRAVTVQRTEGIQVSR